MLADQFLGDEVDADYINGLLISAEQYGFFNPGASIIFNGSVMQYAPPPASGERYSVYPPEVGFQEVYEGSKANKERAKVIRKWLKRRAKELRQEGALEAEPPQVVGSTANEREASLAGLLSFGISPTEVVDLITRTLFAPGSDAPQPNANLRAYAIADALHLRGVITLSKTAFAALIGRGWGVSVGRRRNDPGPVWDELIGPLRDDVLRMKTNTQAHQRKP